MKVYKYTIDILTCLLYAGIIIGSLCAAFTTFIFITAVIGTCYFLVNEPGVFIEPKTATIIISGAGVIGIVVYIKCFCYLSKLAAYWQKTVTPKENKNKEEK